MFSNMLVKAHCHACRNYRCFKILRTVISLSYLLSCFRRINHMAINHLYSSSDVLHRHVWHNNCVSSMVAVYLCNQIYSSSYNCVLSMIVVHLCNQIYSSTHNSVLSTVVLYRYNQIYSSITVYSGGFLCKWTTRYTTL